MRNSCVCLECPKCNTNYEIFLKSLPQLMLFNCSHCSSPISFYNGKLLHIDYDKLKNITINTKNLLSVIEDIYKQACDSESISLNDITDLKIILANCNTFDEWLDFVCKK